MTGYLRPCGDVYIPSSWADHRYRNPPSKEPGTDYAVAIGTPVHAAAAGSVFATYPNTGPAGRTVELRMDDGRTVRYLHLSSFAVSVGRRVGRGDVVAFSGGSGNGQEYYYGAHVHTTLLPSWTTPLNEAIDFELYVGDDDPPTPTPPPETKDEDDMPKNSGFYYDRTSDGRQVSFVVNPASGFFVEWSDTSMTVDDIAQAFDTGPFARITQGMRDTMLSSLNDVQRTQVQVDTAVASTSTATGVWVAVALLALIGLADVVQAVQALIPG